MVKKIFISILIVIVLAGGFYLAYSFGKKSAENTLMEEAAEQAAGQKTPERVLSSSQNVEETAADQGVPVKVATIEQRDIHVAQTFYGTAVPYAEANVQGKYGGKIVFLKGREGDDVKKGEIVVNFDDSDAQLQVQQALANKNSALEQVNLTQSNFNTVRSDFERQEELFKDGIVSQKTVDDARNRLQTAQAALNSAHETVKQSDSQVDLLNNTLNDFKIAAPISGVIDEKRYNLNEVYRAGDVLFHIVDINTVYVEMEVPETYISQIKEQMNAEVFFDPLEEQTFSGVIDRILPKGDPQSRNFLAKVVVENPERAIKAGMFSRVNVMIKSLPGALVIHENALVQEGEKYYVFKVVESRVKKVAVEVTHRDETTAAVVSDELQADEQVVVEGVDRLKPDDLIHIL